MKRQSGDYLIYLVGLAGIVAASSAHASEKQNDLMKVVDSATNWTSVAMRMWIAEAFPEGTFIRVYIKCSPGGPGDGRANVAVEQSKQPGQMKKKLEVIQDDARSCKT